jgi:2-dehydropantoate 2-reductase
MNPEDGVAMDVLDERKGYQKHNQTKYQLKTTEKLDSSSDFDLVIVPTNWIQTQDALKEVAPKCPNAFFFILTSNWVGTDPFDSVLRKDQYILGYPDGGGTLKNGAYWVDIGPEIHIAASTPENQKGFDAIKSVFNQANIKLDIQENMLHWLWVHNAGSLPIMVAYQKHKDIDAYLNDKELLKKSFLATRECLDLCAKRGASSGKYPEVSAFKLPLPLLIPIFKRNFKHNESMQRYTAHASRVPIEDIRQNYNDILKTAEEYKLDMPNFKELGALLQ